MKTLMNLVALVADQSEITAPKVSAEAAARLASKFGTRTAALLLLKAVR